MNFIKFIKFQKKEIFFFKITKQDARKLKYYYVKRDKKFGEKSRGRI